MVLVAEGRYKVDEANLCCHHCLSLILKGENFMWYTAERIAICYNCEWLEFVLSRKEW